MVVVNAILGNRKIKKGTEVTVLIENSTKSIRQYVLQKRSFNNYNEQYIKDVQ